MHRIERIAEHPPSRRRHLPRRAIAAAVGGALAVALLLASPMGPAIRAQDPAEGQGAPRNEQAQAPAEGRGAPRVAFIGLHGGVFDQLRGFSAEVGLGTDYISEDQIKNRECDLSAYRLVFIQHTREDNRESYRELFLAAKKANPALRIFAVGREGLGAVQLFDDLGDANPVEQDPEIGRYLPNSRENLRRFLVYISVKYLGRPGEILPPSDLEAGGMYHPDHEALFESVDDFLEWSQEKRRDPAKLPRAAVLVHRAHLEFQQPRVVDALIRSLEAKGVLAVGFIDSAAVKYEELIRAFKPEVAVHTCHSSETLDFRRALDVPHLHSLFFRRQSIDEWRESAEGLSGSDGAFQIIGQEHLGAIEPQVGAGTTLGQGGSEAFTPIPDRIEHLARRALSWIRLRTTPRAEKRVAVVYWDRELGQNELMRGSATGQFLNGPRSLVRVLRRMKAEGYALSAEPADDEELIGWLKERGRQIGLWDPAALDRLARGGHAALVPEKRYLEWFQTRVPESVRAGVLKHWGPPPGQLLVWSDGRERFIVIPRVDLGNVILLPQPLRGEAHDPSLLHNGVVPPPHNYLATYFWLESEFKAKALVHFGTHGSEFALPSKRLGLSEDDWPDILMGSMPNINPWIINNVGESGPVKRRAYGVLIGHLTPPSTTAGLSDDLANLHALIDKWEGVEEGGLRTTFARQITADVARLNLAKEVGLAEAPPEPYDAEDIRKVSEYLHEVGNETTPISLHVMGEPPRDDLIVPYITTMLKRRFLEGLAAVVPVPDYARDSPGHLDEFLRATAEKVVDRIVHGRAAPAEALKAAGYAVEGPVPADLEASLALAAELTRGFSETGQEIDNLLKALDGRFIPVGPANEPMRNPNAVPTGRNLYMFNPEEIPARPSWEVARALVDQLLRRSLEQKGHYPAKVGFYLRASAFGDYGVMEAQILHLLGVEPVWDEKDAVHDVRVVPMDVLKRPRVDVFVTSSGLYEVNMPGRLELIDKAIRLVAELDEPDNPVRANSERVRSELLKKGVAPDRAALLSLARIFGREPGQYGSPGYYYFIQRSGFWESREEVIERYLMEVKHVYTKGLWGVHAPEAYDSQIQGTDTVLRTWNDYTTGILANKYHWFHTGSLSLAVKHLTGKEPEYLFSDVRDFDNAKLVRAEDVLARDYRIRLFNRKWIEGMMKEGYSGADQIAVMASNSLGWSVVRPGSVPDATWNEIEAVFVRDKLGLSIREWFDAKNPHAFQEMTSTMLEAIRKGYWAADAETTRRLAESYAKSVVKFGSNGGLRTGGNVPLQRFVESALIGAGVPALADLAAEYHAQKQGLNETALAMVGSATPAGPAAAPGEGPAPTPAAAAALAAAAVSPTPGNPVADAAPPVPVPAPGQGDPPATETSAASASGATPPAAQPQPETAPDAPSQEKASGEVVKGRRLVESGARGQESDDKARPAPDPTPWILVGVVAALVIGGFFWRRNAA